MPFGGLRTKVHANGALDDDKYRFFRVALPVLVNQAFQKTAEKRSGDQPGHMGGRQHFYWRLIWFACWRRHHQGSRWRRPGFLGYTRSPSKRRDKDTPSVVWFSLAIWASFGISVNFWSSEFIFLMKISDCTDVYTAIRHRSPVCAILYSSPFSGCLPQEEYCNSSEGKRLQ